MTGGSVGVAGEAPARATTGWEIGPGDGRVYRMTRDKSIPPTLITNFPQLVDSVVRGAASH
jgi:hypothetical protein